MTFSSKILKVDQNQQVMIPWCGYLWLNGSCAVLIKFVLSFSFSGWISSLTGLNKSIPVGIMMIIIAALFTASAVISLVMFKKVSHTLFIFFLHSCGVTKCCLYNACIFYRLKWGRIALNKRNWEVSPQLKGRWMHWTLWLYS